MGPTFYIWLGVVILLSTALSFWQAREQRKQREKMMTEFSKVFPDRCAVCSLHYFLITSGHLEPSTTLPVHRCVERENHGWRWQKGGEV